MLLKPLLSILLPLLPLATCTSLAQPTNSTHAHSISAKMPRSTTTTIASSFAPTKLPTTGEYSYFTVGPKPAASSPNTSTQTSGTTNLGVPRILRKLRLPVSFMTSTAEAAVPAIDNDIELSEKKGAASGAGRASGAGGGHGSAGHAIAGYGRGRARMGGGGDVGSGGTKLMIPGIFRMWGRVSVW